MKSDSINADPLLTSQWERRAACRQRGRKSGFSSAGRASRRIAVPVLRALGVAALSWGAATTLAWEILHLRGYGSVSYRHVAQPWLWPMAARELGEDLIFQGRLLALNGGGDDAVELIAQGASQARDQEACLLLAELLSARHDEMAAMGWLVQGLDWAVPSRGYLQALADLARAQDDTAMLTVVLHELWSSGWGASQPADRTWLAREYARVLQERADWRKLLSWIETLPPDLRQNSDLLHCRISALLALGQGSTVMGLFQRQRLEGAASAGEALALLAEAYSRRGDLEHATRVLQLGLTLAKREPQTWLRLLEVAQLRPELLIWRQRILEEYLRLFGHDEESLAQLAGYLRTQGAVSDLTRLHGHARLSGFAEGPFLFPLVETLLEKGRADLVQQLLPEASRQNWSPTELSRLHALQHLLAEFLTTDSLLPVTDRLNQLPADAHLTEILGVAAILNRTGRPAVARELLTLAQERFPRSRRLRGALHLLTTERSAGLERGEVLVTRS